MTTDYTGMTQLHAVPPALQGSKDRILYLARERRTQHLVALQLHPGSSPSSMWLEVLRRLDASLPGLEERCGACQRVVTAGAKFCPKCGADLSAVPTGGADDVVEAVKQATGTQYEYLGRMDHGTGTPVFIVRERSTGRLAALRLHKRADSASGNQVYDLAGTNVLGRYAQDLGAGSNAPKPDTKLLQAVERAVGSEYEVLGELGRVPATQTQSQVVPPVPLPPPPPPPPPPPAARNPLWAGLAAAALILLVALGVMWWRAQTPVDTMEAVAPVPPPPVAPATPDSATLQIGGNLPNSAQVTVDGQSVPFGMIRLASGAHQFRAEAPGFEPAEESLALATGEVTTWGPRLKRIKPAAPPVARPKAVVTTTYEKPKPVPVAPKPEAKSSCTTYFNAQQDWDLVLKTCEEEGRGGGVAAQQILGLMYEKGLGTPVNRVMAADWYRKAADAGNAKAQYYYGRLLNEGGGNVRRDREQAVSWFTKAANAGEAEAMAALGRALMKGEGTNRNKTEGLRWYEQAAAKGVAEAQYQMALLYKNGDTVGKSDATALEWMEKAAKKGHPKAQAEVGRLRDAVARKGP